ncbi:antibiotic acetyltransferase [Mesorhizobium sp. M2D.F.Ca.ET.185.01.1.1]|uniref:DapH/DapD/GlmU-related protein n=1 Tax=unclassified Mesorhizobium TaxID=325217 RepID=UPI000FCA2324|nr:MULTISPECIES: DapH/DapD/GlmU-related protein [unclassified Mesorhizobium]TGP80399.1 antibiotic acetyltransferase [bacterium M00.F.Ca.ET.227.01.1.1]TGQ00632.1 antibiotic acetyltransferase [bacterium M00.F.Ca.ET.221.01.1.1]TGQ02846.1 antibiotic acetyltransferase [bacterium M00.F.Ca.ET.222.01.1.1]TGU01616.1 antibiotic acetyltransferase [bacterium M00.F.Ca.ET.163.01.1.1]TGU32472.1 antibiotic acetyltransferase [bacterium M00.F.Ca.ET.156.01.1.1]TGU44787.1 antibiotic acetyltransferase [bacterium 
MDRPENLVLKDSEPRIHPTAELKACKLGRYASIGERVILREVSVGDFSYFERHSEAIYTTIGKFCSIAANSRINALEHPIERLTQHKVGYRPNEYFRWLGVDAAFRARRQAKSVSIGHDVWIGHGAVVMPGVVIGNGAVIGANAVVTHDVAPYTIVAGVPAKPLRQRFSADVAARIDSLAWWDWAPEKLARAIPEMQAMPIEAFLDRWEDNTH